MTKPSVDEVMRLADEYGGCRAWQGSGLIDATPEVADARAALESAIRSLVEPVSMKCIHCGTLNIDLSAMKAGDEITIPVNELTSERPVSDEVEALAQLLDEVAESYKPRHPDGGLIFTARQIKKAAAMLRSLSVDATQPASEPSELEALRTAYSNGLRDGKAQRAQPQVDARAVLAGLQETYGAVLSPQMHAAIDAVFATPVAQPQVEPWAELIEAAERFAEPHGDCSQLCRADLLNAFFAGSKYTAPVAQPQVEPTEIQELWEAAGGFPHVKADKRQLLLLLRQLTAEIVKLRERLDDINSKSDDRRTLD